LIDAANDVRHRALLMITYGSGLRVSETVHLKPHHIESDRMLVRIEQAKGRKDRYTLLSQKALDELRIYWKVRRPEKWLFYGRDKAQPMDVTTAQKIYYRTKKAAGITKGKGIHTLRHCFATHLLEQGIDVYLIKGFLGHLSLQTTLVYLHVLPDRLADVKSPLDKLLEP
jgi:site-specific recombinase XerD